VSARFKDNVLTVACRKCKKVQKIDFNDRTLRYKVGTPFELDVICNDEVDPPPAPEFKVGDLVFVNVHPDKPPFEITKINHPINSPKVLIGSAPWWPDAMWSADQISYADKAKAPPPPCTHRWKIKLQLHLTEVK
jgi:hypothetical protein